MTIYEKNMELIKEYDISLYENILEYKLETDSILSYKIETCQSKDGRDVLKIIDSSGKGISLASQYAPSKEATKFVEQYSSINKYAVFVMMGMGNPIIINEMVKKMSSEITFYFYEPDPEIFMAVLKTYDLYDILNVKRINIVIKNINCEDIDIFLSNLITKENYRRCIVDALPKYRQLYAEDFTNLENTYHYLINYKLANLEAASRLGGFMTKNSILNLKYVPACTVEEDLKNQFLNGWNNELPVVIISAGPSLEKNGYLLKTIKNRALIFAVDSALPYLMKSDIVPDVVITIDSQKPSNLFDDERICNIPLVVHADSNHEILKKRNAGKVFIVSAREAYYNSLFAIENKTIYEMPNGGSVATSAFVIAVDWGFKNIVLVGQDLALTDNKVHAGNIGLDDYKLENNHIKIEGYYGEMVDTTPDYDVYRKWFEVNIEKLQGKVQVINATEGGARIKGAIQMSMAEVIDTYCTDIFEYQNVLNNVSETFTNENKRKVICRIKDSIKNLDNLDRYLRESSSLSAEALRMLNRGELNISKLKTIKKKMDQLSEKADALEEIFYLDCLAAREYNDLLENLHEDEEDEVKEQISIYRKVNYYTEVLVKQIPEVKGYFAEVIGELAKQYSSIDKE